MAIEPHPHPTSSRRGPGAVSTPEFAADQLVLGRLGVLQRGLGRGEPGARVGHARAEHQPVEVVAHVVVVADDLGVPGRASGAGRPACTPRAAPAAAARGRPDVGPPPPWWAGCAGRSGGGHGARRRGAAREQPVEVAFDGQVAGDERTGHAQLAGRPQDAPHRVGRADPQGADAVGRPDGAPVPELEAEPGDRCPPRPGGRGRARSAALPGGRHRLGVDRGPEWLGRPAGSDGALSAR